MKNGNDKNDKTPRPNEEQCSQLASHAAHTSRHTDSGVGADGNFNPVCGIVTGHCKGRNERDEGRMSVSHSARCNAANKSGLYDKTRQCGTYPQSITACLPQKAPLTLSQRNGHFRQRAARSHLENNNARHRHAGKPVFLVCSAH